ncbi:MAG TPA: TetR/AcrR family transcriptional regulator [Vicinamibacterales bacterium]|nr:TetR/AcrR family transcriptional regulator [Vicinamibacterales bacterium]
MKEQPKATPEGRRSEVREALLRSTVKLFAEGGTKAASTRRIAKEAGVNEVTLFRHFGKKEDLICSAMRWFADQHRVEPLPAEPRDPERELVDWCREHHHRMYQLRTLIRTCMADHLEHPDRNSPTLKMPVQINNELYEYLLRVRASGLAAGTWDARSAANMLMGALFSDAMGRDAMPERFPNTSDDAIAQYVRLLLTAIGAKFEVRSSRFEVRSA